ncbi:MAG: thrombospondin type 3 repeat-containing protein, partial [Myxococcota bacterium]
SRVAITGALLLAAGSARAQTAAEPRDFSAERFRLALDAEGILDVESGAIPKHLSFNLALWVGFADDPLVVDRRVSGELSRQGALVGSRLGAEVVLSLALFDWIQLGIGLPVVLYQDRQDEIPGVNGLGELDSAGIGSARIVPKIRVLNQAQHGLSLAIMPTFVAPSIQGAGYFGQNTMTFEPELAASRIFGPVTVAANLGYRVRRERRFVDLVVDDELFARLGVGFDLGRAGGPPLGLDLTLAGATSSDDPLAQSNRDYGEILGGLRYRILRPLIAFAGDGVGINRGFGTPDWRAFAGLRWSKDAVDSDNDGVYDGTDACPSEPEDVDGFLDADGCPDVDNDEDGLADAADGAPNLPEDRDGFEDQDGIPDTDNDNDSVKDWDDPCPDRAGPVQNQGCPDEDADADGRVDRLDACPNVAEDLDGYQDEDGCPDLDDDLDGVVDGQDGCPRQAGPAENLGCPDTDSDGDSVVDRLDNCPTDPGDPANQGCKKRQVVKIVTEVGAP